MPDVTPWNADFSYAYYVRILEALRANYTLHLLRDAPDVLAQPHSRTVFLRHDIDISTRVALRMAELEKEYGVASTYMFIPNSRLYKLEETSCRQEVRRIAEMGHEVGLHFDCPDEFRNNPGAAEKLEAQILSACEWMEKVLGLPVLSVSFHRPIPWLLRGPLLLAGKVNAYAAALMDWYLSDSAGRWREGEPLPKITAPSKDVLQLLVHPIWWAETPRTPHENLEQFKREETSGLTDDDAARFCEKIWETIPGARAGAVK